MKLLNEKKQTENDNTKLRLWEIKTKIIYEDDYKTTKEYEKVCRDFDTSDSWVLITSSCGWNGHGGYTMYQKVEE